MNKLRWLEHMRKTGTPSYSRYKRQQMDAFLKRPFDCRNLAPGYGRWLDERMVEYPWCFSHLSDQPGALLDAGSVLNFDYILAYPKLRKKHITIMTLAPEERCYWQQSVSYIFGDLRSTCFRDGHFDEIVCLSTLEHVGLDNSLFFPSGDEVRLSPSLSDLSNTDSQSYLAVIRELRRVLKPGGTLLLSVPFGKHVVRSWFQIFDGQMLDRVIEAFAPSSSSISYFRHNAGVGWHSSTRDDASESRYFDVTLDEPWEGHPAAAEAVACLALKK